MYMCDNSLLSIWRHLRPSGGAAADSVTTRSSLPLSKTPLWKTRVPVLKLFFHWHHVLTTTLLSWEHCLWDYHVPVFKLERIFALLPRLMQ